MGKKALDDMLAVAGGAAALAKNLKISRSAISQWRRVPVNRVLEIEKLTGISRHDLRPDIYGSPSRQAA